MRRIRFVALGIVSFVVSIFGALLAPGTFLNRALSAALCTVFSFNSAVCTASLVQSSERVVAATPPAVERSIADIYGYLQAQRDPSEFGDEPSAPSPGSNPQAPPFPQDPGPNFPLRRPDFDGIDQNSQQIVNTPRDFVLISQTNPSREKREILFKSPSTGAEQIQVVTPVGAEEFKLFEIEFRNLPGTDQPRTRNFKISFDEGAIAKVTLGDGSNAVIRQDNVIVTAPNGQVQSIPIPRNQTSINNGMIGSKYFDITENLETSWLLKSENNLISKEECVKKILNEYKVIEGRVKLAYNLMLLAASVWLGLTTGGTGGVIAAAILEAIGLALQQALEEAKILSDYDEYKRKQAEEMCKQTQPGGNAPVVTSFTCNGGITCTARWGSSPTLRFAYEDKDGNASSWEITGYTRGQPVAKGTISPPNGSGTINDSAKCEGGGSRDFPVSVTVTDTTGLKSDPLSVTVMCR